VHVLLNGQSIEVAEEITLAQLIEQKSFERLGVAVAISRTFVPRRDWQGRLLKPGDQIEVVVPMQGG
jgi:sulfur carrier protein